MAKTKHKNLSQTFHNSRPRIKSSHLSRAKIRDRKIFLTAKSAILTIIILTTIVFILTTLFTSFFNPENIIKDKVESIATDYYENYFYPSIVTDNHELPSAIFSRYTNTGFSQITFRQLLLFDSERYAEAAAAISAYCDLNKSFIQFYPTPPFNKSDFRADYRYSCTF